MSENQENKPLIIKTASSVSSPAMEPSMKDSCDYDLKTEFKGLTCNDENYYSNECNKFLLKKEFVERNCLSEHPESDPYLYPNLNDKIFNIKI